MMYIELYSKCNLGLSYFSVAVIQHPDKVIYGSSVHLDSVPRQSPHGGENMVAGA